MNTSTVNSTAGGSSFNPLLEADAEVPCLCCEKPVQLRMALWSVLEQPAALCRQCFNLIPFMVVKQLFMLRLQVAELFKKTEQLFKVQQELEEAVFEPS
jgi:hypothetical protein